MEFILLDLMPVFGGHYMTERMREVMADHFRHTGGTGREVYEHGIRDFSGFLARRTFERIRILLYLFGHISRRLHVLGAKPALELDVDIPQRHILDAITGNARNQYGVAGIGIADVEVAYPYPPESSDRSPFRTAHTGSEAEEKGRIGAFDGNVVEGHVFKYATVHGLEKYASAVFQYAVGDRDIAESAAGESVIVLLLHSTPLPVLQLPM